jgi:hypothetical protein
MSSSPGGQAGRVSPDEPDFIVVKAGFEYGGDLALVVVEVKKHKGSDSAIHAQHFPQETCT